MTCQQLVGLSAADISALTALLAVVIGPMVSLYVMRRQIRSTVVSANRQKWIDSVREHLVDLITEVRLVGLHKGLELMDRGEYDERLQRLLLLESRLILLLNPIEIDHKDLTVKIRSTLERLFAGQEDEKRQQISEALPIIIKQSQTILKREWLRVKSGD